MGSTTAKPPGSAAMSFEARLCLHQGRDKSVRNVLVAGGFLRQNSSTFEFSHYLLRRSHLTHKTRSQHGTGWPTATPSSHPGWFVSNTHTGCPALRGSIKGLPGRAEEGHGYGCTWVSSLHSSGSGNHRTTQRTDLALQDMGTIAPGLLAPDQFRREALPTSHSKDNPVRASLE